MRKKTECPSENDEDQTSEQRNQISQTRLEGIVLSHKVIFADDRVCHTPLSNKLKWLFHINFLIKNAIEECILNI